MPSGGARKGAGRKPKPLSEKLAAGNPGKRELTRMAFGDGTEPPRAPEYLRDLESKRVPASMPTPTEIFDELVRYIEPSGCLGLIPTQLIVNHTMATYFLLNAQYELSKMSIVGYDDKKELIVTPFTDALLKVQRYEHSTWDAIWTILKGNAESMVVRPGDDLIANILAARVRREPGKSTKTAKGVTASGTAEDTGGEAEPGGVQPT